jgi:hypothetical protein
MLRCTRFHALALLTLALPAAAQEYKVTPLASPAPSGAVAPEIASLLDAKGLQVAKGSQVVVELWLAKEWPIAADAKTGGEVIYPFTPGQVIGVARYPRKANDFRDHDIPAGAYVVRYAQQPVDGAHVGTSATRDFFALVPAAKDRDPKPLEAKALSEASKETTGTAHPAILSLQRAEPAGEKLAIREESDKEWVIVRFVGKSKQGADSKELPVELVVVGKAAE